MNIQSMVRNEDDELIEVQLIYNNKKRILKGKQANHWITCVNQTFLLLLEQGITVEGFDNFKWETVNTVK